MISYLAGKPVASQWMASRFVPYQQRGMWKAEGEYAGPDPLWEGCPIVYEGAVQQSMQMLHGHLTFDAKTGAITHVAPSIVSMCTKLYTVMHDDADVSRLFSGMVPEARVLGSWCDIASKRFLQCTRAKHVWCVNPCHDEALPRDKISHADYCMATFKRVLCDDCVEKTYFRHVCPTAAYVGSGYLAVGPLKRRIDEPLWSEAFGWLEQLTELKILSQLFEVSLLRANAIMMRPYEAIVCNQIDETNFPKRKTLAIIARTGMRRTLLDKRTLNDVMIKKSLTYEAVLGMLWKHGMVTISNVNQRKRKLSFRMKAIVEGVSYQRFISDIASGMMMIETAAARALQYLLKLDVLALTVRIANRKTGAGIDCGESTETGSVLDRAEHASWGMVYAMLCEQGQKRVSGSLHASLTGAALTVFAVLVEMAISDHVPGVTLDRAADFLEPDRPLEDGDLRRLVVEQAFLESGEGLPTYDEPVAEGRLALDEIELFVLS